MNAKTPNRTANATHRTAVFLLLAALIFPAAAAASADGSPTATAARSCSSPKYPGSGYFTSLSVTGVSCSTGKKVALGYYKCRVRAGGAKGACRKRVRDFKCSERRTSIPTQINALVTCKRGSKRVVHSYQQDT